MVGRSNRASRAGRPLSVNDVIIAEVSAGIADIGSLRGLLETLRLVSLPMSDTALFLAGKAFVAYRARGGLRTGVLPDFFIGAQAQATGLPLLTRDVGRYRSYFPAVPLVTP